MSSMNLYHDENSGNKTSSPLESTVKTGTYIGFFAGGAAFSFYVGGRTLYNFWCCRTGGAEDFGVVLIAAVTPLTFLIGGVVGGGLGASISALGYGAVRGVERCVSVIRRRMYE